MFGKKLLFVIIFAMLIPTSVSTASGATFSTNDLITVEIISAYYTDIDNDGRDDDVYSAIRVTIQPRGLQIYDYLVELELPSGAVFSYYYIISTNIKTIVFDNLFYDHATEAGWYKISASAILFSSQFAYAESVLIFDPPGGSGDAEPPAFNLVAKY